MNRINSLLTIILIGALVSVGFGQADQSSKPSLPDNVLERQVLGDDLEYLSTKHALHRALARARVAGGTVSITDCEEEPLTQRWLPAGSQLKVILNSIVMADPKYRWVVDNNTINLIPKEGEPDMLKTSIKEFHLNNPTDLDTALDQLLALPEVKQNKTKLGFGTGVQLFVRPSTKNEPKITLHCENVTLREALNAIAGAYGQAVWAYHERTCGGKRLFFVDFVVRLYR